MILKQWFTILTTNIMSNPVVVLADMLQMAYLKGRIVKKNPRTSDKEKYSDRAILRHFPFF